MLLVGWKSKRAYAFKLNLLCTVVLYNIKRFVYKIGMQFNKSVLVLEQSNYPTKIVNTYIVYDLNDWP